MLDLKRDLHGLTIDTVPSPLLQQILSNFVAVQRPLLILDSGYLGLLQRLRIEAHEFQRDPTDRKPSAQSRHPLDRCLHTVAKAWWQPAYGPAAILKPWGTIAEIRRATSPTIGAALSQFLPNLRPTMVQFPEPHCMAGGTGFTRHGQPGGFGAGIDPEDERLTDAAHTISESNRKWIWSHDYRAALLKEHPRPGRMTGH